MKDEKVKKREEQLQKYLEIQRGEMLGALNKYYARQKLGREPTESEAIMHYIKNGGAEDFFARFGHLICRFPPDEN